uniref:CD8+ T-cell target antigen Tp9 n=2 Tax=Theileria parva TaxID=5875 RepID=I3RV95_THEPA|nr:CD8+ T-cell target antigen Tp9 [Theileria parva lawrencei]
MNVLTTGIILYSFYMSICMDPDDNDDVFGDDEGSMLPKHQRSSMLGSGLGSTFTSGYSDQEFDEKFQRMGIGKKPKDKGKPHPTKPVKSTLMPEAGQSGAVGGYGAAGPYGQTGYVGQPGPYGQTGYVGQPGAVGPYGGGYPTQGPYGQPGAGPYGQTGYPTQPGAAGGYPGGYTGQPGATGGYGAGYSGQGGYPPQGYGQPGQGPYPPSGPSGGHGAGAGGYGGGAPGPGQPSGPTGQTHGGNMLTIDAKTKHNGPNIIVDEYRAGPQDRRHRQFDPVPGCGIIQVNYDGRKVWTASGPEHAVKVVVFPLGFKEKTIEITFIGGEKAIYKKPGRNKPWTKQ